ncbi:MAG: serine/threonine-protein phosphatase [Lachnospiraceae bacterium]|nr:serine/threonine-protein phosphatase [Lachnospiraceae bacterium]
MNYQAVLRSSMGTGRLKNQDSGLVLTTITPMGILALGAVCDGMGGLSCGEVASSHIIRNLMRWMRIRAPYLERFDKLAYEVERVLWQSSQEIFDYGKSQQITLGSTATILLLLEGRYVILHVGDTRGYRMGRGLLGTWNITQITQDQSVNDSVLTQCIGSGAPLKPAVYEGRYHKGDVFLLCSDGLRHHNQPKELLHPFLKEGGLFQSFYKKEEKKERYEKHLDRFMERARSLGEEDDITGILIWGQPSAV